MVLYERLASSTGVCHDEGVAPGTIITEWQNLNITEEWQNLKQVLNRKQPASPFSRHIGGKAESPVQK